MTRAWTRSCVASFVRKDRVLQMLLRANLQDRATAVMSGANLQDRATAVMSGADLQDRATAVMLEGVRVLYSDVQRVSSVAAMFYSLFLPKYG